MSCHLSLIFTNKLHPSETRYSANIAYLQLFIKIFNNIPLISRGGSRAGLWGGGHNPELDFGGTISVISC